MNSLSEKRFHQQNITEIFNTLLACSITPPMPQKDPTNFIIYRYLMMIIRTCQQYSIIHFLKIHSKFPGYFQNSSIVFKSLSLLILKDFLDLCKCCLSLMILLFFTEVIFKLEFTDEDFSFKCFPKYWFCWGVFVKIIRQNIQSGISEAEHPVQNIQCWICLLWIEI